MAGYTRNDTSNNIATGNVINAADLDGEFDALVAAFHASTGHTHDGTAANGAPITKIGPAQDLVISTGAITPKTDNTVDLGSSSFEFKDLYIDGTANIDALVADTADINAGTIDGVTLGTNSAVTEAQIDNININGNTISSTDTNGNISLVPNGTGDVILTADTIQVGDSNTDVTVTTNGTGDLIFNTNAGTNSGLIRIYDGANGNIALTPNGTGEVDISKVDIDSGAIDGTAIGANSASTGAFTTLTASGNVTLSGGTANGVLYLNGSKVATSGSALTFDGSTFSVAGEVRANATFRSSDGTNIGIFGSNVLAAGVIGVTSSNAIPLAFGVGASEQMRLTSTGLGIGTSSPAYKLDVSTTSGDTQAAVYDRGSGSSAARLDLRTSGTGASQWYIQTGNTTSGLNGSLRFYDQSVGERMRLDSSGNLGLGVTPSAWSQGRAFEVFQAGYGVWNGTASAYLLANTYYNSGFKYAASSVEASHYYQYQGAHVWSTAPSGTAGNAISFTQAMTLDASGRLLIGATSGSRKLEVHTDNGTETAVLLNQSGVGAATLSVPASTNALAFGVFDGGSGLVTERARITSGGDLLVGTTTAAGEGFTLYPFGSSGGPLLVWNRASTTNTTTAADFRNATASVGNITYTNTATAYNTSSDYRLKDSPQPLTNSGTFIDALKPKTWNWKADGSKGVGFIAHEVQEVSPSSVTGEKDGEEMQAMEYGSAEFIANIIAELQSLRQRVAQLEGTQP